MYEILVKIMADYLVLPILLLSFYIIVIKPSRINLYDRYTRVFMAGVTSYLLAKIIGNLWQPEQLRPFELLGTNPGATYLANPGFPSDHALLAFFLLFASWYMYRNSKLVQALAVLVALMCLGRVLALVHTPLDILGSLVITSVASLWYIDKNKRLYRNIVKKAKT